MQHELSLFYRIIIIVLSLENKYTIQYNDTQILTIFCRGSVVDCLHNVDIIIPRCNIYNITIVTMLFVRENK